MFLSLISQRVLLLPKYMSKCRAHWSSRALLLHVSLISVSVNDSSVNRLFSSQPIHGYTAAVTKLRVVKAHMHRLFFNPLDSVNQVRIFDP